MLQAAGVTVRMGTEVTADLVRAERPDVLIVATGTRPFIPKYVPGWDRDFVTDYEKITSGSAAPGHRVVVLGGQTIGMGVAEVLADKGSEVTVIEASGAIAQDLEFMAQKLLNTRLAMSNQIRVRLSANVEEIGDGAVRLQSNGEHETLEDVDQVVLALEREENRDLTHEVLEGVVEELGIEFHAIGDCNWPGDPYAAILSGNRVASAL